MSLARIFLLSIPVAAASLACAQKPVVELDFELVGGRIYLPAQLNGHATSVVLDTGASASVMDLELAQRWDLPMRGRLDARGSGGERVKGKHLGDARLTFGGIVEPIRFAIPLGNLTEKEGRPLETIAGRHFFDKHVVEIDYAKRRVRIFDARSDATREGAVLPIRFVHGRPHVTAKLTIGESVRELEAMVDTGASGTSLTAKFLAGHRLDVSATARTVVSGGVGGATEGRLFRPDAIGLGSLAFASPIVAMVETAGGAQGLDALYDLNIGSDLLRRCRVTIDYPRGAIVLQPVDEISEPFEADKTGLMLAARGADLRSFEVIGVLAGSSAEAAGVERGDVIESIDDAPASTHTLQELREVFRSPGATGWKLGLRRGDERLSVSVPARSII